jgi:hypothetical protein
MLITGIRRSLHIIAMITRRSLFQSERLAIRQMASQLLEFSLNIDELYAEQVALSK